MKDFIIKDVKIIPERLILQNSLWKIFTIKEKYIIKEYRIILDNKNKLDKVFLINSKHPNCNPRTNEFCIPNGIKNNPIHFKEICSNLITNEIRNFDCNYIKKGEPIQFEELCNILEKMFKTFNLDSCYFGLRAEDFKYRRYDEFEKKSID